MILGSGVRYILSLFQEQYILKSLVAALIKKRDINILMILRCSMVCVSSTVTICRVLDDVAATHTSSACVIPPLVGERRFID